MDNLELTMVLWLVIGIIFFIVLLVGDYIVSMRKEIKKQGRQIQTILSWRREFIKTGKGCNKSIRGE